MRKSVGEDISPTENVLENEHLRVEVVANGTLNVTEKAFWPHLRRACTTSRTPATWATTGPTIRRTIIGIYTTLTGKVQTWTEDNGPLCATIAIEYTMDLPAFGRESLYGVRGESKRSEETVPFKIVSRVTLKKGSRRVDIKTSLRNNVRNHRLRVAFPTGIRAKFADAAGHFTVDSRPRTPQREPDGTFWPEMQTLPMQHFVDVSDGKPRRWRC